MTSKATVGLIAGVVPALLVTRDVLRDWGATKGEQALRLPGDELEWDRLAAALSAR